MSGKSRRYLRFSALRIVQDPEHPLYLFVLNPEELFEIADISRLGRSSDGDLIGYQRPQVRKHVQNIVSYLDSEDSRVLFPHSLILALPSAVRFQRSRDRLLAGGRGEAGVLRIPYPRPGQPKPAWIVDGQQRAVALSRAKDSDFPVPVSAFVADDIETQREQFLRINSTKPLPRGLVSELLPQVSGDLPPALSARKIPAVLCEMLNRDKDSPFFGLIKRSSLTPAQRKKAIISDTTVIKMIEESFTSPTGALFAYRNIATGETDYVRVHHLLKAYWSAVKATFPNAWGVPPTRSRLMHSVGMRAMGRLMDRVMGSLNVDDPRLLNKLKRDLARLKPHCQWTSGTWSDLGGIRWNDLQNVPAHLRMLTNHLLRTYMVAGRERG